MNHFELREGELACEDVPLRRIAEAVGTPVYVYSTATLERHFTVFRDALRSHVEIGEPLIAYALKANSNVAVVRTFKDVTFVRTKLTEEDKRISQAEVAAGRRPLQTLRAGENVITGMVVQLAGALEELAAKQHTSASVNR